MPFSTPFPPKHFLGRKPDAYPFIPTQRLRHECHLCNRLYDSSGQLASHVQDRHWTSEQEQQSKRLHAEVAQRRRKMGLSPTPDFTGNPWSLR